MNDKIELLAPAGDMECLDSALNFGADAVYLAGTKFGMRTASKKLTNACILPLLQQRPQS